MKKGALNIRVLVYFGDKEQMFDSLKKIINYKEFMQFGKMEFNGSKSLFLKDSGYSVLWMDRQPKTQKSISVLSHEIINCAMLLMEGLDAIYLSKASELYAYLIECLTKDIYKKANIKIDK